VGSIQEGPNPSIGGIAVFKPSVQNVEEQLVAYKMMVGEYSKTPEGLGELYRWIEASGIVPAGVPQAVYLTMPETSPESEALWELWAPVAGAVEEREPDDRGIGIKTVPATRSASLMYQGPYEDIGPEYARLWTWIAENSFVPSGPPRELWYSDPATTEPAEYLTEIQMPIV